MLTRTRCLLLAAAAFAGLAHAGTVGTWYDVDDVDGAFTLTYKSKTYNLSATPALYLDDQVWYYNANLTPQSPSALETVVENRYGLLAGSLSTVAYCDNVSTGSCVKATAKNATLNGVPTSTFTATTPFDYLAIHLGNGELIFHWSLATSTFTLAGMPTASISNYRAFVGPQVLATPLPGAALLFASALGGAGFVARRRGRKQPSAA
ncbi:hypothetical protein JJB11_20700 [Ramlibacter ginsenosidimutans]|uniref:PEP-CTERM sorting domain-containing protein n=1 Tax=Ramlibacter ginsenosidimutans TaxID=502333 RepID=A0A934TW53_9BURK|nr:hypothetical protein [Ramlibacter ginsenosidimutans]MBK6008528.1 hypothetical protein [Ramlibacter ginsenosidimutans]